jgi:hypothetical protein
MKRVGRKLLVASLGVVSVSYGGCGGTLTSTTDGAVDAAKRGDGSDRLDGESDFKSGPTDASDAAIDRQFIGNLVAL